MPLGLVVGGEFVEQLRVDLHEGFEDVVNERDDGLVPVLLGDAVETREHDGQDDGRVLLDQRRHVVVVPVQQGPLRNLWGEQRRCVCVCVCVCVCMCVCRCGVCV